MVPLSEFILMKYFPVVKLETSTVLVFCAFGMTITLFLKWLVNMFLKIKILQILPSQTRQNHILQGRLNQVF
ncbi:MAG: hypothetical protein RL494_1613 [Bacteroidota bacterium]